MSLWLAGAASHTLTSVLCASRFDNCSAVGVEAKHLDVKSGALSTNGKEDWLVQLLQHEKRQDDAGIFGASLRVTGRDTLLRPSVST